MQGRKEYIEKHITCFQLSSRVPKHNRSSGLVLPPIKGDARPDCSGSPALSMRPRNSSMAIQETLQLIQSYSLSSCSSVVWRILPPTESWSSIARYGRDGVPLDMLYFLGYNIDEPLPWHSTLSRTRQLYPEALFEAVFDKVFSLCVANNMVAGRRVAIDSAPVKANASMERLLEKQPNLPGPRLIQSTEGQDEPVPSIAPLSPRQAASVITAADHQLRRLKKHQQNLKSAPTTLGAGNEKAKLLSNRSGGPQNPLQSHRSRCPHLN